MIILFFAVFIVFVGLIVYGFVVKRKREEAMADLAAQKGWMPLGNQPDGLRQYLPLYLQGLGEGGFVFQNGFTHYTDAFDMAYQATINDAQIVFFQYQYTEYYFEFDPVTNQQHERSETHYFIVVNAAVGNTMPVVLLLHHSFLSKLTSFSEHTGLQSLSLEGDFNKYFDTYITPDSQVDALTLLTPDTMELVINAANGASMQIAGQSIVLSFEKKYLTPNVIEPVLDGMTKLITNISNKAESRLQDTE